MCGAGLDNTGDTGGTTLLQALLAAREPSSQLSRYGKGAMLCSRPRAARGINELGPLAGWGGISFACSPFLELCDDLGGGRFCDARWAARSTVVASGWSARQRKV